MFDEYDPFKLYTVFDQGRSTGRSLFITTLSDEMLAEKGVKHVTNDGWFLVEGDDTSIYAVLAKFTSDEATDRLIDILYLAPITTDISPLRQQRDLHLHNGTGSNTPGCSHPTADRQSI